MKIVANKSFSRAAKSCIALMLTLFAIIPELVAQKAVPTFHCLGLYWKPAGASASNTCTIQYRVEGQSAWVDAAPLWYDSADHANLAEYSKQYRGSIFNLYPDTKYQVKFTLASGTTSTITASTMSETFPVSSTVTLPKNSTGSLSITSGGSPTGYKLYTAAPGGSTIDVNGKVSTCITVDASYVIIRGLTLKNAANHGIVLNNVNHVIIEDCDISGWGEFVTSGKLKGFGKNLESAVFSNKKTLENIIIQRNRIHDPRTDANSWEEPAADTHPEGPQAITFKSSEGGHIIRYNNFSTSVDHKYNDVMGETDNFSYRGFPGKDSDIYGNIIAGAWDDGIEAEGGGMNVRIFGNYIDETYMGLGLATCSMGPLYVYKNIDDRSIRAPYPVPKYNYSGNFIKLGTELSKVAYLKGKMYFYHNTLLQRPYNQTGYTLPMNGVTGGFQTTGSTKHQENMESRNNILHMRGSSNKAIRDNQAYPSNNFNYDLYTGTISAVKGSEANGVNAAPSYTYAPGESTLKYKLEAGSPGIDQGVYVPNFSDGYAGSAPDMGAYEAGAAKYTWGTTANWTNNIPSKAPIKLVAVTGVSISATSLSLSKGQTKALNAVVSPSDATNKSVTWSSSNTKIATVNSSGVVTAQAVGRVTISVATLDGNKTATCGVSVIDQSAPAPGIILPPGTIVLTAEADDCIGSSYNRTTMKMSGNGVAQKGWWRFNCTGIPAGATISKATLSFTVADKGCETIIINDFKPKVAIWDESSEPNPLAGRAGKRFGTIDASSAGRKEVVVTSAVSAGGYVTLQFSNTANNCFGSLYAHEYTIDSERPKLTVSYTESTSTASKSSVMAVNALSSVVSEIRVYPNPLQEDALTIDLAGLQNVRVQIQSVIGQVVYSQEDVNGSLEIPKSIFSSGLYVVHISNEKVVQEIKLDVK